MEQRNMTQIGNIKVYLDKKLGSGDNGDVFVGKHGSKIVAIKVTDVNRQKELENEFNHLHRCKHDNVITYYGHEKLDGKLYIAMERYEETLEDWVRRRGVPVLPAKTTILQMVEAVAYLHSMNIVHCDLQPKHFVISKPARNTNEPHRVMVTKFGQSIREITRTREQIEEGISSDGTSILEKRKPDSFGWIDGVILEFPADAEFATTSDIFSLGLSMGYVFSGGKHPFGDTTNDRVENLKSGKCNMEEFTTLDPCFLDLFRRCIGSSRKRPTAELMKGHPYFWSDKTSLDYLVTLHNDKLNDIANKTRLEGSKDDRDQVLNIDWKCHLHNQCSVMNTLVAKYDGASLCDLLRFIRNKSEHYGELTFDQKNAVGPKPDDTNEGSTNYWQFWAKLFPHLLIYTWRLMEVNNPLLISPRRRR